jgi:hypothetical protein
MMSAMASVASAQVGAERRRDEVLPSGWTITSSATAPPRGAGMIAARTVGPAAPSSSKWIRRERAATRAASSSRVVQSGRAWTSSRAEVAAGSTGAAAARITGISRTAMSTATRELTRAVRTPRDVSIGAMRPVALIALVICSAACTGGQTVNLGNISPVPYHFDAPVMVAELASSSRSDNPTLTGDLLEIYFTTDRVSGNGDVWFATRTAATAPFGTPAPVTAVNTDSFETSSAISTDGLTLWFGSDRAGGLGANDIWVTQRATRASAWSTPVDVVPLNTPADDIPRPPGEHALVMPMASTKVTDHNPAAGNYQTYLATRATPAASFGPPVAIPELDDADRSTVDGFLTDDGLTMFFSSAPLAESADAAVTASDGGRSGDAGVANSDLFAAWRRSTSEPFSVPLPLDDLNTSADERDPWLSPDGTTLYFTSDRSGVLNIYTAQVKPR